MDETAAHAWRATIRKRLLVAAVLFGLWGAGIEARLVWLQVHQYDDLTSRAARQQRRTVDVTARRGDIVDRQGRTLALSVSAETVYAIPAAIEHPDKTMAILCGALDGCSPADRDALVARVRQNQKKQFLFLKRQIAPEEARRIAALDLEGISLVTESRRFYPNRELAAHVLGYVGVDNRGLGGIEAAYDSKIRGVEGKLLVDTDARRRAFGRIDRPPTTGATVELTIDARLQHVAERELRAAVTARGAAGGTVIIMDPRSGEILALANEPTFNPNTFRDAKPEHRRNRSVQEIYEPGSTFKVVTASAAIEEQAFGLDDPIDVSEGAIRIASRTIEDVHRYDILSFTDVIVKSSNVGAIKVGSRLGAERLSRYVRRFGFGTRLCPDLPGESAGQLSDPATWSASALASISMGYEIGVTPMQMVTAMSSVANGGSLIQPRVVRAIRQGALRTVVDPLELRHTINARTVADLTAIMEQVVDRGTGTAAQIPGFTVAGKTGTAAKIEDGRYSKTDYFASFVGFVPSRFPALTILVVIDSPRGGRYYGGDVAAPVFKRVAEQALRHLGIAPNVSPAPPVLAVDNPFAPAAGVVTAASTGGGPEVEVATGPPVVPDLIGLSARDAVLRLARLGLTARVIGDGIVRDQEPPAGSPFEHRSTCTLRLERLPLLPSPSPTPQ